MSDHTYLDWPFFDDSHRKFVIDLGEWAENERASLQHEEPKDNAELDELCNNFVKKLGEGGWLRYCVPETYGG